MLLSNATQFKAEGAAGVARVAGRNRRLLTTLGFGAAGLVLLLVGAVSYRSAQLAQERALAVAHTHEVVNTIQETLNLITDAETAQRGFILTGRTEYLEPFERTVVLYPKTIKRLRELTADNPRQHGHLENLKRYADQKIALLAQGPQFRLDAERLSESINSGLGKRLMDQIRTEVTQMTGIENALLQQRSAESEQSLDTTQAVILAGFALAVALIGLSYLLLREEGRERDRAEERVRGLNARLERHAKQLEISNRELEGFSYSVSHDLRIPLRAVSGYAQMLEEDAGASLDAEGQRMLGLVRSNAATMGALIDDLLTFSRLGGKAVQAIEVDMNQVVAAAVEQCTGPGPAIIDGAGVPVLLTPEAPLPDDPGAAGAQDNSRPLIRVASLPPVQGDPALLRQVWLNLLSNAIKYSATRRPPQIEVSGKLEGGEAVYTVRDNGVGFDMRYASKLFGVFQRLHGADEYPGTGVGLAIVQRVVTRHGGRVWADAKLGEGATFSFALPLQGPTRETDESDHATH